MTLQRALFQKPLSAPWSPSHLSYCNACEQFHLYLPSICTLLSHLRKFSIEIAIFFPYYQSLVHRRLSHSLIHTHFINQIQIKLFCAATGLRLVAYAYAISMSASSVASIRVISSIPASSVPVATVAAPYPSSVKGATQIADGQIQATGSAETTSVAKPTASPKSGNPIVPFADAGSRVGLSGGGFMAVLAAAVVPF